MDKNTEDKKKNVAAISKGQLNNIIKESVDLALNENAAIDLNHDEGPQPLAEMAKLNLKDNGSSEFPSNAYRVWVQGDNSPHKPAHMHIRSNQDGWEIKVYIENGELWQVENYGRRNRRDTFSDIIKLVKSWFGKPTCMPGRVGTNQEAAMNEWEACNAF